jgi:hypothetical protein
MGPSEPHNVRADASPAAAWQNDLGASGAVSGWP